MPELILGCAGRSARMLGISPSWKLGFAGNLVAGSFIPQGAHQNLCHHIILISIVILQQRAQKLSLHSHAGQCKWEQQELHLPGPGHTRTRWDFTAVPRNPRAAPRGSKHPPQRCRRKSGAGAAGAPWSWHSCNWGLPTALRHKLGKPARGKNASYAPVVQCFNADSRKGQGQPGGVELKVCAGTALYAKWWTITCWDI